MGFSTDAIHAGQTPDQKTGAVITPIYQSTTFAHDELGVPREFEYSRTGNPTRQVMEKNIAALEKGKYGVAFSSGVAAIHAVMGLLKAGDHIIAAGNVYGGTYRLLELIMKDYGIHISWVDMGDIKNIENAIKPNTRIVYLETPSNPMLTLTDLTATADFCRSHKLISVVDNTFMSPYFQNPLLLGCDIVLHSSTKYLNGHSDVIGGIVITDNDDIHRRLRYIQNAVGAVPSPFDCWLTLRSTKTLAVRMQKHAENAMALADYMDKSGLFRRVIYPGLPSHPDHELAKKQMRGFGGIITLETGDFELSRKILNGVRIFTLAESLGGVESLIAHPATMTHASVPKAEREKAGITDSLIRLSVGIEDIEDLIADIKQAAGDTF